MILNALKPLVEYYQRRYMHDDYYKRLQVRILLVVSSATFYELPDMTLEQLAFMSSCRPASRYFKAAIKRHLDIGSLVAYSDEDDELRIVITPAGQKVIGKPDPVKGRPAPSLFESQQELMQRITHCLSSPELLIFNHLYDTYPTPMNNQEDLRMLSVAHGLGIIAMVASLFTLGFSNLIYMKPYDGPLKCTVHLSPWVFWHSDPQEEPGGRQ